MNLKTGEQVWEKPLKYKRAENVSVTHDKARNRYLLVTDDELFSIDENSGDISLLAEPKLEGKENANNIEIRENGIMLSSDQNLMLLDWEGNTIWHEYYRAPGKSAAGAIFAGAMMVASAYAAVETASYANAHRNKLGRLTSKGERYQELANDLANVAGKSMQEMVKRFKATAATQNSQFVLTKFENKDIGLVKLDKTTGEMKKEISLNDKKPIYEVDELAGVLYYQDGNQNIQAFDLTK